jgi:hypothetical protein
MNAHDRVQLLFGPYRASRRRKGVRASCLSLDTDVAVTSRTDARVRWPLCRPLDNRMGRPTILLDGEPARAVRHEAAALRHWWRVGVALVWRWWRCLGVGRRDSAASLRAPVRHAAIDKTPACVRRASCIISAGGTRVIPNPEEPIERTRASGRVFRVATRRLE